MTSLSETWLLDPEILAELADLDPNGELGLLKDIFNTFFQQSAIQLASMERGCSCSDAQMIETAAHTLKGASLTVGAKALAGACASLEVIAQSGSLVEARTAHQQAAALREKTTQEMKLWLAGKVG